MSPAQLESMIQRAAVWLYERDREHSDNGSLWLTPAVLTAANPNKPEPGFSQADAVVVFAHLFQRGLLTPTQVPLKDENGNDRIVSAYFVNHTQDTAWKELTTKSGWWELTALPIARWLFGKWPAATALILFMFGAILTTLLTNVTEDLYERYWQSYIRP